MKLLISSLEDDQSGNIFVESKLQSNIIIKKYDDLIIHLTNRFGDHITGFSLIRLNNEGLMKFKKIGFIGAHLASDRSPQSLNRIDLDKERKLIIIGVDLL
jgi:hypothetical protein